MIKQRKTANQKGQILVILLLIMIVGLTVGLFLMGRTTSDISLTGEMTESARAFNAAEAGIEESIRLGAGLTTGTPIPVASGVTYTVERANLGVGSGRIYPEAKAAPVALGDTFTVWLVEHDAVTGELILDPDYAESRIDVCFDEPAAIGITLYYLTAGNQMLSAITGYDGNGSRQAENGFLDPTGNCSSYGYTTRARVNFGPDLGVVNDAGNRLVALRVRPLYSATALAVVLPDAAAVLPTQGADISSLGISGGTARRIDVAAPYKIPAPFMDQALYSVSQSQGLNK